LLLERKLIRGFTIARSQNLNIKITEGLFDYNLWGLFLASFLAATVVPFSSEALLTFLIVNGTDAYAAVLVATVGNWLGGMSSYAIGYLGKW
jgi:membrane protein YqaA with SNARE-associated domain